MTSSATGSGTLSTLSSSSSEAVSNGASISSAPEGHSLPPPLPTPVPRLPAVAVAESVSTGSQLEALSEILDLSLLDDDDDGPLSPLLEEEEAGEMHHHERGSSDVQENGDAIPGEVDFLNDSFSLSTDEEDDEDAAGKTEDATGAPAVWASLSGPSLISAIDSAMKSGRRGSGPRGGGGAGAPGGIVQVEGGRVKLRQGPDNEDDARDALLVQRRLAGGGLGGTELQDPDNGDSDTWQDVGGGDDGDAFDLGSEGVREGESGLDDQEGSIDSDGFADLMSGLLRDVNRGLAAMQLRQEGTVGTSASGAYGGGSGAGRASNSNPQPGGGAGLHREPSFGDDIVR